MGGQWPRRPRLLAPTGNIGGPQPHDRVAPKASNTHARFMQEATGLSLKKVITTLRPLREFVGEIDGHELVFPPEVPPNVAELISSVESFGPRPGH